MSIKWDTHIHTKYSEDSDALLSDMIDKATSLGLDGICITDHMDYDFSEDELYVFDWDDYESDIQKMKLISPIKVLTGVECGLQSTESVIAKNIALRAKKSQDYMIGSIHLVDHKDPYYASFWEGKDPDSCIKRYFESMYTNLQAFHDFDSLGHLDYIVRYAPSDYHYEPMFFIDIWEEILRMLIRYDIALEVNTSGFKKEGRCQNPHQAILFRYKEMGGELITIGSDAHDPKYIGYQYNQVCETIKKSGLRQYAIYEKHKPVFYDL